MGLSTLCFDVSAPLKLPPLSTSYIECNFSEGLTCDDLVDPLFTDVPLPLGNPPLLRAQFHSARTLTSGDDVKESIELVLDLKHPHDFMPGDSIGIFPKNDDGEVNVILDASGLSEMSNAPVSISIRGSSKKKLPTYLPAVTTPRILLESVLEIRGILKKTFLRSLAEHTTSSTEKRRLLELCSIEGSSEYDRVVLKGGATLSDILTSLPSCRPPLALLIEHLPRLMPRAYSIASSPLASSTLLKIVFNVVTCPNGKPGVCSSWLKREIEQFNDVAAAFKKLSVGDNTEKCSTVPLFFRKLSNFRLPEDPTVPLIMIGPGTGIAPFLGFLEHLKLSNCSEGPSAPTRLVYFGCRYPDRDSIYKEDFEEMERSGVITKYKICYSRGRETNQPKYVQDLLHADKETVRALLDDNGTIFICGDALNMAKDVQAAILRIIKETPGCREEEAVEKMKKLESDGRIVKDVWR